MRSLLVATLVLSACAHTPSTPSEVDRILLAADRTEADRTMDSGRRPGPFLAFVDAKPGMHVGEVFAGSGYTTELLVRAVGPTGKVYGHNTPELLKMFLEKPWSERLARPVNGSVVRVDRPIESPFPPEAEGTLDRVVTNANYHDAVAFGNDRIQMNQAVKTALKSGGTYIVCDSSAKDGSGAADSKTLHRIDQKYVEREILMAGFRLVESGDFLRNPGDARDWNASPIDAGDKRGTSDRFCLKFVK
ncbi:MAG: class I SAM-dependent methyltransferase [Myxococcaceae bacterium]